MRIPLLAVLLLVAGGVSAEPVALRGGAGSGLLFSHAGLCWAVLPAHVHGMRRTVNVTTSLPNNDGAADIEDLGQSALDLSLALVEGPAADNRCELPWASLPRDLTRTLVGNPGGVLVRVFENGTVRRLPVRVRSFDYSHVVVDVSEPDATIAQGWSGATLEIAGRPAGLAIETRDGSSAVVMRMDAIVSWIGRYVEERRSGGTSAPVAPPGELDVSLPFRVVHASATPLTEEARAANLADGAQPYLTASLSDPLQIDLALAAEEPVTIRRVRILADPGDERYTTPRFVVVEVDEGTPDRPRPRAIASGQMPPSGEFVASAGGGTNTRLVRIHVTSSWKPDLPLRIDRVVID